MPCAATASASAISATRASRPQPSSRSRWRSCIGQQIAPAKAQGLSAAVYTQLSDVEDELNGLLTYDRKVVKMAPEVMRDIVNVGK